MQKDNLFKKIFGCLVGGAIGDAFGIRVEMMHYLDIKEQYGWVTHFDELPPRKHSTRSPLERWNPIGLQMGNVEGVLREWRFIDTAFVEFRLPRCIHPSLASHRD